MSDFECINGHMMRSGHVQCPECGGKLGRMDGKTSQQLQDEDDHYRRGRYYTPSYEEDDG